MNVAPQTQQQERVFTPVFKENLSEEQIFLMQIINGEIELHDNDTVLAELKQALGL